MQTRYDILMLDKRFINVKLETTLPKQEKHKSDDTDIDDIDEECDNYKAGFITGYEKGIADGKK
jgi:hypothetical protein